MRTRDDFIRYIITRSGIVSRKARRELERELSAHLDDALEQTISDGHDEAAAFEIAYGRFGDPDDIAHDFANVNRFERIGKLILLSLVWMGISMITVGGMILSLQLLVAVFSGKPTANAFPYFGQELGAFASLVLGYMGLYMEEDLFEKSRLLKAAAINCPIFAFLAALASVGLHWSTVSLALAFVSGMVVRALQQTAIRRAWILGPAIPIALVWLITGSVSGNHDHAPLLAAALLRWVGLTAACYSLTLLARKHRSLSDPSI